jgi:hypothetical protein
LLWKNHSIHCARDNFLRGNGTGASPDVIRRRSVRRLQVGLKEASLASCKAEHDAAVFIPGAEKSQQSQAKTPAPQRKINTLQACGVGLRPAYLLFQKGSTRS